MTKLKQFAVPLTFIFVGLVTVPWEGDQKWIWRGLILYSIPLTCYLSSSLKVKEIGFLFGMCILFQALASPFLLNKVILKDYVTLEPNFHEVINVKKGVITGIEGDQAYITDEKGFRVTRKIDYENKSANILRIFAIGASTVEGMLLGDQVNWPHLIQEKLSSALISKQVEVINTGKSATSSRNHLATFRQILKYEPDIAIFLMGANDWSHHIKSSQNQKKIFHKLSNKIGMHLTTEIKENLAAWRTAIRFDNTLIAEVIKVVKKKLKKKKTPRKETLYQKFAGGSITTSMGSLNRADKRIFRPTRVSPEYRYFVSKIGKICIDGNITCIFVSQPTAYKNGAGDKIKAKFWVTPHKENYTLDFDSLVHVSSLYNDFIISYARSNNIANCDLAEQTPPTLKYFWDDVHFNVGGTKKASEVIFECVMRTLNSSSPYPSLHENS